MEIMLLRDTRLRAFHTVASQGSFTGAARHLLLTQQAISFQIKSLEDEVGGQLFTRDGRAIELTDLGQLLFSHAQRILDLYGEAEAELSSFTKDLRGRLRIATTNSLAKYVMPRAIGALRTLNQDVKVTMEVGNSDYALGCLRNDLADVAFCSDGPDQLENYQAELFFQDEIVFIVPGDHPWAKTKQVAFAAFCAAPIILREEGSGTRSLIERAMTEKSTSLDQLDIVSVLGSAEAVKGAVEAGAGVGMVSRLSLRRELADGSLAAVRIEGFRLLRNFYIVRLRQKPIHRRVQQFIELARQAVA
ncbi:LysR family transcriptional regulator (plasmid) [Agrobacterium vitis]|nr:LysR family transcriptional regulator [Allorhizobium ampelinum]MUZ55604.1 LysR family transcriptional regulator [Agrobacterium vitis]MVA43226.1 LysR family transcriptional regulator [Agrobacterium vitis]NSX99128.1 LysR family transcriptional regulator [Agrobacterium vitis]UJL80368.1 LysR family transcriptional regulator [Agrobacterium vitis]